MQARTPLLYILLLATITISPLSTQATPHQNWLKGPTEISNQFPLAKLHSSLRPQSPEVKPSGSTQLAANFIWSNNLNLREDGYIIDAETRDLNLNIKHSLTDRFEAGINIPVYYRGGGILDHWVDQYHKYLGLKRGSRNLVADDQYQIAGLNKDGSIFNLSEDGFELANIGLNSKYLLTAGDEHSPAWSAALELGLPTATGDGFGHKGVDITAALLGSYLPLEKLALYWGAAWIYFSDDEIEGVAFKENHAEGFFGVEYGYTHDLSFLAVVHLSNQLIESVNRFDDYSVYGDLGLKYGVGAKTTLEFLFREDLGPSKSTTDFSILFGISWHV